MAPIPPGAVDPVRLAHVLAEADPWLDAEDYYQPTAADEELIFLLDHPELAEAGVLDQEHRSPAPIPAPTNAPNSIPGDQADHGWIPDDDGWIPDDDDDPTERARWHPAARVPAHLPRLEDRPGGAELAAILAGANLADLGAYELVEHVAACERVASAMHALQAKSIAELMRREQLRPLAGARAVIDSARATALEVAARLARSGGEADALVARAGYLTTTLPDTYRAWAAGEIDTDKADLIGRKLCRLDAALARRVEASVLPEAPRVTLDRLRRLIVKEIHRLNPKDADQRHREARQGRFVRIIPTDDGMAWIEAYVSAADAAAVKAVLDAGAEALKRHDHARRDHRDTARGGRAPSRPGDRGEAGAGAGAGDRGEAGPEGSAAGHGDGDGDDGDRTMANRRADVLTSLAWAAMASGRIGGCNRCRAGLKLADAHGRPVTVNVTVPVTALLGRDDEPAVLEGYGSITPAAARELARNSVWRRLLTDPQSGTVLDVGRTRYRPPADLTEHILLRDVTCVWPGCDRPANGLGIELDHIQAWVDGGVTAAHNLGAFCAKHHTDKHETGWLVSQPEPGRFDFTSPTGHTYTRQPAQSSSKEAARSDPEAPDSTDPPPF